MRLKANNKLLQQKIGHNTGKKVTLKDICNIKHRIKFLLNKNDLDLIVDFLYKEGDSSESSKSETFAKYNIAYCS